MADNSRWDQAVKIATLEQELLFEQRAHEKDLAGYRVQFAECSAVTHGYAKEENGGSADARTCSLSNVIRLAETAETLRKDNIRLRALLSIAGDLMTDFDKGLFNSYLKEHNA